MSARLRDARRDHGLSLEDLSKVVQVPVTSLSNYERGAAVPSPARAKRIADYFGVKQSWFWPTAPRDNVTAFPASSGPDLPDAA